jgi:hypothetical protein
MQVAPKSDLALKNHAVRANGKDGPSIVEGRFDLSEIRRFGFESRPRAFSFELDYLEDPKL